MRIMPPCVELALRIMRGTSERAEEHAAAILRPTPHPVFDANGTTKYVLVSHRTTEMAPRRGDRAWQEGTNYGCRGRSGEPISAGDHRRRERSRTQTVFGVGENGLIVPMECARICGRNVGADNQALFCAEN